MDPGSVPWIPLALAALLLLPFRVSSERLPRLAFWIWILAGVALSVRGASRFARAGAGGDAIGLAVLVALAIGLLKGRFILSRAAAKNLVRLRALRGAARAAQVYSPASWILIGVFMSLGMGLGILHAPVVWRAGISLAVGVALVVSSFDYLRS